MRNGPDSDTTSPMDLSIPSDTFIPTKRVNIPGGVIFSRVEIAISVGASIISLSQNLSEIVCNRLLYDNRHEDRIIVRFESR